MRGKLVYSIVSLILLLSTIKIFSQEIIYCKAVTENGEPIGIISNRKIDVNSKIYILIKINELLITENINLLIEKINKNNKQNIFSASIKFNNQKNWAAYEYSFKQEGIYSISLVNNKEEKISTNFLLVENSQNNFIGINNSEIFPNSKIIFCEKVIGNKPVNIIEKISLHKSREVIIYFINNRPFNTDIIQVRIWKKKNINSPYEDFVDSKKFKIEPEWYDTYFKYQFNSEGYYRLDIFNDKELLLKRAYINVEK
ncbi:MAG: hypothetical protein QHH13_03615 [Melioribacter sp.]|uniref:hypothetical protein n=1 Tax=Rosettibacter primus TaxID=3111523 RepID=UPI00247B38BA|nr:hypothetical protein [Melioribacter sp.]